jgi:hypothetical protein
MEDDLTFWQMEDSIIFFENGRQTQFLNGRQTQLYMGDYLNHWLINDEFIIQEKQNQSLIEYFLYFYHLQSRHT